jgi:hypothetical protein
MVKNINKNKTQTILKTLKEYGDPISVKALQTFTGFNNQAIYDSIYKLTLQKYNIKKVKNKGKSVAYQFVNTPASAVKPQPKLKPTPCPECFPSASLIQRCYHYINAKVITSTIDIQDFFDISEKDAIILLRNTAEKYNNISLTVTAKLKGEVK